MLKRMRDLIAMGMTNDEIVKKYISLTPSIVKQDLEVCGARCKGTGFLSFEHGFEPCDCMFYEDINEKGHCVTCGQYVFDRSESVRHDQEPTDENEANKPLF